MDLLTEALNRSHDYYHLLSGVDLPLKTQKEMVTFFERNYGCEFIGISPNWADNPEIFQRYKLHWFFQDKIGKNKNMIYVVSRLITKIEKFLKFQRSRKETIRFFGGPEWFSITEEAAKYIVQYADWAKKRFKHTLCSDEIYAQTIIGNSDFVNRIYKYESGNPYIECLRYAKFNGSSPFVLEIKDYDSIMKSGCLFARKFGTQNENQRLLVEKIYSKYK